MTKYLDIVVAQNYMKFFFALLATLFLATPAWAVDVMMGANGNLVFEPAEVTILQVSQFISSTTCFHHTT